MILPREDIFFFEGSKKRKLLGFIHRPLKQSRDIGILYCHPFADEQNLSHRIAVNTSRALANEGCTVFRFDMSGCGDSMAELFDVSVSDWLEDISFALNILKKETKLKHLILWGIRLGAGLSLLKSTQIKKISALVLINPILNFEEYIHQFLRRKMLVSSYDKLDSKKANNYVKNINESGKIDVLGYTISKKFFEDMLKIGIEPSKLHPRCKILLMTVSLMNVPPVKFLKYFEYQTENKAMITFKHVKTETFWDRYWRWECQEIADNTINWIISNFK